jgi:hypothetical protein
MLDMEKEERLKQFEHQNKYFAIIKSQKADKDYDSADLKEPDSGRLANLALQK